VDRNHRHEGVAAIAVQGALDLIAQAGGGVVEAYPQDTAGKKISASFLYSATIDALTDCPQACTADVDADLGELWQVLTPADSRPRLCLADQAGVLHA